MLPARARSRRGRAATGCAAVPDLRDTDPVAPVDHQVTLLTRAGCHLCDEARAAVARIADELGAGWQELDVDADAELRGEYGDLVPVVLVDDVEQGYLGVDERALRALLLD